MAIGLFFLPPPSATLFEFFYDIVAYADNDIWLASQYGMYHYNGTEWMFNDLGPCRGLTVDSQGKIYARSENKIYMIDNGVISEYNVSNSPISDLLITAHGIDTDDNLWIGTGDWNGGNVIQKVSSAGNWITYSVVDHPAIDRPVGDFHFDNDGNVWVANDAYGAIRFDGVAFTNPVFDNSSAIANTTVNSIEIDAAGKIYFAHQYGVTTLDDGVWDDLLIDDVPAVSTSFSSEIQIDDEGTLWWGSIVYGLFSYSQETVSTISTSNKITTNFSIYPNPAKDLTTLDFETSRTSKVLVKIYNQLGQLITELDLGEFPVGNFQQTISLVHLPKGSYSLLLQIDNEISVNTIVVQ